MYKDDEIQDKIYQLECQKEELEVKVTDLKNALVDLQAVVNNCSEYNLMYFGFDELKGCAINEYLDRVERTITDEIDEINLDIKDIISELQDLEESDSYTGDEQNISQWEFIDKSSNFNKRG